MYQIDNFGQRIKALRCTKGLSQEQLAWRANTSVGLVSRIERGLGNPQLFTILSFANALEIEPYKLLMEQNEDPKEEPK